jgi:hypothetical protein
MRGRWISLFRKKSLRKARVPPPIKGNARVFRHKKSLSLFYFGFYLQCGQLFAELSANPEEKFGR